MKKVSKQDKEIFSVAQYDGSDLSLVKSFIIEELFIV